MKHRILSLTLAVLLFMTALSGCAAIRTLDAAEDSLENKVDAVEDKIERRFEQSVSQAVTPAPQTTAYATPTPDQITQAEALEIALAHAGVPADQAQYLYTEYEIDDRIPQYDVQFYADGIEYEYEIHAETGEILSFDRDN